MNKTIVLIIFAFFCLTACQPKTKINNDPDRMMADQIKSEFLRSWNAYKTFAWGHDVLLPVSESHIDWYENSLGISPIDAYSTMKVMGLDEEAALVQQYVAETLKYFYLVFANPEEINPNECVYTTEAHPFFIN